MERANSMAPKTAKVVSILMAISATFLVLVVVMVQWTSYNWLRKSLAIVVLLNVAVGSVVIRRLQEKYKVPEMVVQQAYGWLILATVLFGGLGSKSLP